MQLLHAIFCITDNIKTLPHDNVLTQRELPITSESKTSCSINKNLPRKPWNKNDFINKFIYILKYAEEILLSPLEITTLMFLANKGNKRQLPECF